MSTLHMYKLDLSQTIVRYLYTVYIVEMNVSIVYQAWFPLTRERTQVDYKHVTE